MIDIGPNWQYWDRLDWRKEQVVSTDEIDVIVDIIEENKRIDGTHSSFEKFLVGHQWQEPNREILFDKDQIQKLPPLMTS